MKAEWFSPAIKPAYFDLQLFPAPLPAVHFSAFAEEVRITYKSAPARLTPCPCSSNLVFHRLNTITRDSGTLSLTTCFHFQDWCCEVTRTTFASCFDPWGKWCLFHYLPPCELVLTHTVRATLQRTEGPRSKRRGTSLAPRKAPPPQIGGSEVQRASEWMA